MSQRDERAPDARTDADVDHAARTDADLDGDARIRAERARDHATIARLADDLLPALVAKLSASGLGEIEVREGDWKVRLRMPAGASDRRPAGRAGAPVRSSGPLPGAPAPAAGTASGGTPGAATPTPRPGAVATSPGVGFYTPRPGLTVGSRVRAGDRLGTVDVLGIPHDVVAPTGGVAGRTYAEPGEAVEYGQELVRIELPGAPHGGPGTPEADRREPAAPDTLAPDARVPDVRARWSDA